MGLFDFRTIAQRKEDEERYAEMIFPRGMQVQDELYGIIARLCPKSKPNWIMLGFVTGKEGVVKLREKMRRAGEGIPTYEQELEAALRRINPKRSKLDPYETQCALALIFADLAADAGEEMASVEELVARVEKTDTAKLPVYSKK